MSSTCIALRPERAYANSFMFGQARPCDERLGILGSPVGRGDMQGGGAFDTIHGPDAAFRRAVPAHF